MNKTNYEKLVKSLERLKKQYVNYQLNRERTFKIRRCLV